jgi:3-oxoacyl-[acyl-carrier protein] reductase/meso-butanediol dehydrogenase/(S,S)-butanediol dehydrogenase/diacetyl reductase
MKKIQQKSVVITGGSRGIGLDITKAFVNAGYQVIVGARQQPDLNDDFAERITFVSSDVCHEASHSKLIECAMQKTGKLDVYINNAGFSEWRPLAEVDELFFNKMINTNLKGAFWGCKAAVNAMQEGGTIINISSLAGKRGSANNTAYCASKFGMNGLTQALAKEVGSHRIRVNAICPVLIPTEGLIEALMSPYAPAKCDPTNFIANFAIENAALKRLPEGSEVAAMCLFLASDAASAITGQCINVDCGVFPQ